MATAMTMPMNAIAQVVDCSPAANAAVAGDTINCVAAAPATISGFSTTVNDLTVNIGDATTPTSVTSEVRATVSDGTHTINILNTGTTVDSGLSSNYGVRVNSTASANIDINSEGSITSGRYGIGIFSDTAGSGTIDITTANVSGSSVINGASGIFSRSRGAETTIDTTAGVITASRGIAVFQLNDGDVSVTTANVDGVNGDAIYARSDGGDVEIDTTAGVVTGSAYGIRGRNSVTSAESNITITTGNVSSTQRDAVDGRTINGDVTIDTTQGTIISAQSEGVRGYVQGSGSVTITTADVTSQNSGYGVFARSRGAADTGSVMVDTTAGTVTAGTAGDTNASGGILGQATSTQNVTITTADVTAYTFDAAVEGSVNGGNLDIDTSAGTIYSTARGIRTRQTTGGDVTITTSDVEGGEAQGIFSRGYAAGTTTINTNNNNAAGEVSTVYGGSYGIFASNSVTNTEPSNLDITTANITGDTREAIYARVNNGNITIDTTAGIATGGRRGIWANTAVTGDVDIKTGDVNSGTSIGIQATAADGSVSVDTSAGTLDSGHRGIYARASSDDDITITTAGVFADDDGIIVRGNGGLITIDTTAGDVSGYYYGIRARNYNGGSVSITAANVSMSDDSYDYGWAITATAGNSGNNNGTDITITTTGDVTGGYYGIYANNRDNDGTVTINVNSGTVALQNTYGYGYGIVGRSTLGATVNIANGATVSAANNFGAISLYDNSNLGEDILNIRGAVVGNIFTNDATDTLNLFSTGSIDGDADLQLGNDIFNYEGGSFTLVDGGGGINTVNFNAGFDFIGSSSLPANTADYSSNITNFSIFNFNGGVSNYNDALSADTVSIGVDGTLNTDSTSVDIDVSDTFINDGVLTINDAAIGEFLIDGAGGNFTQTSTGTTVITVEGDSADLLSVSGTADLEGTLELNQTGIQTGTVTILEAGTIDGEFEQVTGLASGLLIGQTIEYIDGATDSVELTSDVSDNADNIDGLSANQVALANALTGQLIAGNFSGDLYDYGIDIISGDTVAKLSEALEDVLPNAGLGGVQVSQNTMGQFSLQLMGQAGAPSGSGIVQTASNNPSFASSAFGNNGGAGNVWGAVHYNTVEGGDTGAGAFDADGYDITAGISGGDMGGASVGAAISYAVYDSDIAGATTDTVESTLLSIGAYASKAINESGAGLNTRLDGAFSYSTGDNDITQSVAAVGATPASTNTASAEITGYSAVAKLTVSGQDGSDWMLKPYLIAGFDSVTQDAYVLGSGAGQLNVGESSADRFNFGYGLSYERDLGDGLLLNASATGLHHTGDTAVTTSTNFAGSTASNSAFATSSSDIETEFILEGGISRITDNDWALGVSGYAQFGDLEGFGGRIKIGRTF